jgi:hypothetical protein
VINRQVASEKRSIASYCLGNPSYQPTFPLPATRPSSLAEGQHTPQPAKAGLSQLRSVYVISEDQLLTYDTNNASMNLVAHEGFLLGIMLGSMPGHETDLIELLAQTSRGEDGLLIASLATLLSQGMGEAAESQILKTSQRILQSLENIRALEVN